METPISFNASNLRKITEENLKGPVIGCFVDALNKEMTRLAKAGKSQILPWTYLSSLRMKNPTTDESEAIKLHYSNLGFKWQDHENPDPGHPCSNSYTTISW